MAGASPRRPVPQIETAASNLLLEVVAGEVIESLRGAGRRSVLIKGATTARWLYENEPRAYGDVDLLVDPAFFYDCEDVLVSMGFERSLIERVFAKGSPSHASTWLRASVMVDLHRTLIGVGVSAEEAWVVLASNTEIWTVGRAEVEVLNPAARALVIALHMAQHGPQFGRTSDDLERAVARLPESAWVEAATLACSLQAETSLAAGLLAVKGGRDLCNALGLRLAGAVAIEGSTSFHTVQGLLWLMQTRGVCARARYLRLKLIPPPSVMRSRIVWSRSGWPALGLAYGLRFARIALHTPHAVWTLVRLRRSAG
jgi:hypothetical protein